MCKLVTTTFFSLKFINAGRVTTTQVAPIMAGPSQSLAPWEIDHTTGDYIPYSVWIVCGFSNVPQNLYVQGLWQDAYSLLSLSEKARKMSLQRQHFLLSYFKTPNVDSTRVWTIGLPLGRVVLIQLSMSMSRCSCFGIYITFIKINYHH